MQTKSLVKTLLVAVPFSLVSALTLAAPQDELKRVEVSGKQETMARTDVKASCPSISSVLQSKLAPIWGLHQETGTVHVEFTVDADGVHGIRSKGATTYREGIRKAMRDLECKTGSSQPQNYAFNIHIISPDSTRPGQQMAMLID